MPYKDRNKQREYQRGWYHRNKAKIAAYQQGYRKRHRHALNQWFVDLKMGMKCMLCGENRWYTLDFHHKDGEKKEHGISRMVKHRYSKKMILAEMEKCVVVCANCHRFLHSEEGENWSRGVNG